MIDFSKIKNNKALQVAAIIAVPTVLVLGYFGYKYIKRKAEEKKLRDSIDVLNRQNSAEMIACRERYKNINSIDEFIEAAKCLEDTSHFGYDMTIIGKKKDNLEKMGLEKVRKLYELVKISTRNKTSKQQREFLDLIHEVYPNTK